MPGPDAVIANGDDEKEPERPDSAVDLSDDYVLTRDAAASARLNLSHYVWHSSFGYNLHPRIREAIAGKENLHVADIGTGTGWVRQRLYEEVTWADLIDQNMASRYGTADASLLPIRWHRHQLRSMPATGVAAQ